MPKGIECSPRGEDNREPFSMRIDPWIKIQAMRAAYERGQSLSSFIEDAVRAALDDREPNVG